MGGTAPLYLPTKLKSAASTASSGMMLSTSASGSAQLELRGPVVQISDSRIQGEHLMISGSVRGQGHALLHDATMVLSSTTATSLPGEITVTGSDFRVFIPMKTLRWGCEEPLPLGGYSPRVVSADGEMRKCSFDDGLSAQLPIERFA